MIVTLRMGRNFKRGGEIERERNQSEIDMKKREFLLGLIKDKTALFSSTLNVIVLLKLYTHTHCPAQYTSKCKIHQQ